MHRRWRHHRAQKSLNIADNERSTEAVSVGRSTPVDRPVGYRGAGLYRANHGRGRCW